MTVKITKTFQKDLRKIKNNALDTKIKKLISDLQKAENFLDFSNVKKMKNYITYYRIRYGDFRVGFKYENNTITLMRIFNRKDIYKHFP